MKFFFITFILLSVFGCNRNIPVNCDCKFMFDIALQKDNPKFSKYSDLFDEDLYFSCVENYISENNLDSNLDPLILDVYYFYTNLCPEYEIHFD